MKQTALKVEHRRTQYALPPYAIAALFWNISFSAGNNSFPSFFFFFKETIVLNSLFMINCSCWTDFFF